MKSTVKTQAVIKAVIIRAGGKREDIGVISSCSKTLYYRMKRWLQRNLKIALAALLLALLTGHPFVLAATITAAGDGVISNRINGAGTIPSYLAWGTGTQATPKTATTLSAETTTTNDPGYARVAGTVSLTTTTYTNDTFQVVGTLTAGAALTITEAGLFDAVTVGNLFLYGSFTGIALNTNDSIQFTMQAVND